MPENKELPKSLGLAALIIYGVGDMLGAGIYGLIGAAAGVMGSMVWAGFLISAIAAGLTAISYASLGSRYPKAGGAAYITERAFKSRGLSYVMGLAVMASGLISMAASARAFSSYGTAILAFVPTNLIAAFFIAMLAFIVFLGMRESSWMNALCTAVELGGLIFIIVIAIPYWSSADLFILPIEKTNAYLPLLLLQGAVLTFYAFIGFEDLLNIAEEVKDPAKHFAIGILGAMAITTLVYLAVSISAVSVVEPQTLAATKTGPLVLVVEKAAPWFNSSVFGIVALFAIANTALLNYVMASRLAFGMSRQGLLPAVFCRLHHRRQTPFIAIVIIFFVVLTLSLLGDIGQLASATSILLLLVFIIMNLSLIILKSRKSEDKGSFEVPYIIPILGILINAGLLAARFTAEDRRPFYIASGLLIGITAVYLFTAHKKITT